MLSRRHRVAAEDRHHAACDLGELSVEAAFGVHETHRLARAGDPLLEQHVGADGVQGVDRCPALLEIDDGGRAQPLRFTAVRDPRTRRLRHCRQTDLGDRSLDVRDAVDPHAAGDPYAEVGGDAESLFLVDCRVECDRRGERDRALPFQLLAPGLDGVDRAVVHRNDGAYRSFTGECEDRVDHQIGLRLPVGDDGSRRAQARCKRRDRRRRCTFDRADEMAGAPEMLERDETLT